MKCILYIVSFVSICLSNALSQTNDEYSVNYSFIKDPILKGKIDFVLGYSGIKNNGLELGISRGYRGYEGWAYVYSSYQLTVEVFSKNTNLYIAPKVGYSTSIAFLNLGAYVINYVDTKTGNNNLFFRPEIGPTFFGVATIFYGYNFGNNSNNPINHHTIGGRLTLGKGSLKGITY